MLVLKAFFMLQENKILLSLSWSTHFGRPRAVCFILLPGSESILTLKYDGIMVYKCNRESQQWGSNSSTSFLRMRCLSTVDLGLRTERESSLRSLNYMNLGEKGWTSWPSNGELPNVPREENCGGRNVLKWLHPTPTPTPHPVLSGGGEGDAAFPAWRYSGPHSHHIKRSQSLQNGFFCCFCFCRSGSRENLLNMELNHVQPDKSNSVPPVSKEVIETNGILTALSPGAAHYLVQFGGVWRRCMAEQSRAEHCVVLCCVVLCCVVCCVVLWSCAVCTVVLCCVVWCSVMWW